MCVCVCVCVCVLYIANVFYPCYKSTYIPIWFMYMSNFKVILKCGLLDWLDAIGVTVLVGLIVKGCN